MRNKRVWILLTLGILTLTVAAVSGGPVTAQQSSLEAEFRSAAEESGVPVELLKAMGYVNTRWETPPEQSRDGGWGVMHLVENPNTDTLGEAARVAGIPEAQLRTSRAENIRGGAALLAELQREKPGDLNGWYWAVAEYGGGAVYANQVYDTLQSGASSTISTGETVTLEAQSGVKTRGILSTASSPGYPEAIWYPASSSNYTPANRPDSHSIDKIVVHVTQGSYASALNWFQNPISGVSAHYTVRSSDGVVGQSVSEMNLAYHAGNWNYNQTSVGIEHEGYVDDPSWFTGAMYQSSAKLAAYLVEKYDIPIDREHIVGHSEVPGATHTDPGGYWDWGRYMSLIRQYADVEPDYEQVVDNASNVSSGDFSASGSWGWSRWSPNRYHWNYRFAEPSTTESDTAEYRFDIPANGEYAVYAWWPDHPGYSTSAPIGVKTASGWEWSWVDQTSNGGQWVELGTFDMTAGDETKVQVSRWSYAEGYIIADAMKVVRK